MTTIISGVTVEYPEDMPQDEAEKYAEAELALWSANKKELGRINLEIDGSEVVVKTWEKSPIVRVRRITGYLSRIENFNDSKQAELSDRTTQNLTLDQLAIRE